MARRGRFYQPPVDPRDERIRRLEDELWGVRDDIVGLMPDKFSKLLSGYYSLETRSDYHRWRRETIDAIVAMTEPDPKAPNPYEDRARCPLCNASGDVYGSGFKLPLGLERHLAGWGNVSQCPVTNAAFRNALYSRRDKFDRAEEAAREKLEHRKVSERVLLIDPAEEPVLFDEQLWWRKPRNLDQLAAAEQRLRDLNFEIEVNGNVVACKFTYVEWLVLADPRCEGRIEFKVFKKSDKKARRRVSRKFYLLDSWSVDLPSKFQKRLRQLCEEWPQ